MSPNGVLRDVVVQTIPETFSGSEDVTLSLDRRVAGMICKGEYHATQRAHFTTEPKLKILEETRKPNTTVAECSGSGDTRLFRGLKMLHFLDR